MKRAVFLGRLRSPSPHSIFHETCPFSHPFSALFSLWLASLTAAGLLPIGAACLCAQTTTWNSGTGCWSDGSLWSTGAVPNGAGFDVAIDGGQTGTASVVTMDDSYTVGRLTLDAGDTLNLANNIDFTVTNGAFAGSGALVNNGTVNFNSTGSGVYLHFNGAGTLAGTGTINLTGVNDRIFAVNAGDQITVGSGVTVAGTGNLGNSRTTFINQGLVTANQSGNTLTLQLGAGYTFTNAAGGTARAENGGVLALSDGTFSGGTFTALAGSQVRVNTGATVSGATLVSNGTGAVTMDSATLANTTLSGSVSANDNADATLADTLTNDGNFTFNSTGSGIYLHLAGAVTLATDSLSTLTLVGPNDRVFANHAGDRLTINGNVTVQGVGNLGNGSTVFTNSGTIRANVSGGTADFTNNSAGTLLASNGGTLVFSNGNGGTLTNNGDIEVEDGSTFSIPAGALTNLSGTTLTGGRYFAGSFDASHPATLSLGGCSIVTNNAAVELDGRGPSSARSTHWRQSAAAAP